MKIKNAVICQNCSAENEYYKETCKSCKAYLRARVFNIDLWSSIWHLIESPLKAFKEIIFAEHKNYIVFLLILMGGKYFINSLIISNFIYYKDSINETKFSQVFPVILIFAALIFLYSYISTRVMNSLGYRNITKSVMAVLTYSFVPSVLILVILAPIEFALFGQHWFYHNPSPITLKGNAAYILFALEGIVFIWCCILSIKGFFALTGSKPISLIIGILFILVITAGMIFIPLIY